MTFDRQTVNGQEYMVMDSQARGDIVPLQSALYRTSKAAFDNDYHLKIPSGVDFSKNYSSIQGNTVYISDRVIKKGTFINSIKYKANGSGATGRFYVLDANTKVVIFRKEFAVQSGANTVDIQFAVDVDAVFGIEGSKIGYITSSQWVDYNNSLNTTTGLYESTQYNVPIGQTMPIEYTQSSSFFCFALELDVTVTKSRYDHACKAVSNNIAEPALSDLSEYTGKTPFNSYYVSDRIISAGSIIKSIRIVGATGSQQGKADILFVDSNDKIVYYREFTNIIIGDEVSIDIGFYADTDVRLGIACNMPYKTSNRKGVIEEKYLFCKDGLYEGSAIASPTIGTTLPITKTSNDYFALCCQLLYDKIETNLVDDLTAFKDDAKYKEVKNSWLPKGLQTNLNLPRYVESAGKFALIGRWYRKTVNDLDCYVTNNCGSEIHIKTNGVSILTIAWQAMTETNAYYSYSIDEGSLTRNLITSNTIELPDTGIHYVRIITDGITEDIGKWTTGKGFAFSGITADSGVITSVYPENPLIMFFGDSITEGIRALGITPTSDMGDTNSATGAFPWFCCKKIGAISYRIGYGASGITVNGSFRKAIDAAQFFWNGSIVDEVFPNAIVINHGTNDTSASSATFISGYNAFLAKLQTMYPGVSIFIMIPFNQAHAEDIRNVVDNNMGVFLIETSDWSGIEYADDIHPTSAGAKVAGEYLADALLELIY